MICFADQCSSARACSLCASVIRSKRGAADSIVSLKSASQSFIAQFPLQAWLDQGNALVSADDASYLVTRFIPCLNVSLDAGRVFFCADNHHPDAHVESPKHLWLFDIADAPH